MLQDPIINAAFDKEYYINGILRFEVTSALYVSWTAVLADPQYAESLILEGHFSGISTISRKPYTIAVRRRIST